MLKKGTRVQIAYTGTSPDDPAFEDCRDADNPFEFTIGMRRIFPPIEEELMSMSVGETRKVSIEPHMGFGEVNEDAIRSFPLITMPNWQNLEEGMYIEVHSDRAAQPGRALVKSLEHDVLVLDFNHPMAGKSLEYTVTLLAANPGCRRSDSQKPE